MSTINNIAFKGWEGNERLKGRLTNEKELNNLANASGVDRLITNLSKESKYLPNHDLYTTTAIKKVNGMYYHGFDCVLLNKGTSKEQVSKSVFESAQKSVGKVYGKLAGLDIEPPKKSNIFKKLLQIFKKH